MKKFGSLFMLAALFLTVACSRVEPGHVGVKVYLNGGDKGVDSEALGVGRYFIGINEELYIFPTFTQNYVWTKSADEGSLTDESITFQSKEGMSINADFGISYAIDPSKVTLVFQKYRKGVDEITDIYLRNAVRDAINKVASTLSVEEAYSTKKTFLMDEVMKLVRNDVAGIGINIEKIYLIGEMRLPKAVIDALNAKIEATQLAQKAQNEVLTAKAEAEAQIAQAKGEAESNRLKQQSISDNLIRMEAIKKWNGTLPAYMTGTVPFVKLQ